MDRRWGRLAKAIDEERQRLRMSWASLAKAARFSDRTLYDLRDGVRTSYQPETLDRLERALRWETGSVERVLAGRRPIRKVDVDLARIEAAWPTLPANVRRVLADVAANWRD